MAEQHTPTPWVMGNDHQLVGANGKRVVVKNLPISTSLAGGVPEYEANAKFIVRACNAYDEMLAALKAVAAVVDDAGVLREGWTTHKAVLAAIELAEQAQ